MRIAVFSITLASALFALPPAGAQGQQAAREAPAPKNLQILTSDVQLPAVMQTFNTALGVQCVYCHVNGDFASDANPKKAIARTMLRMLKQVATHFPDTGNDFEHSRYLPFPEGKQYVTCYSCHRGAVTPANNLPDWHGPDRAPEPGAPPPGGGRRGGAGRRGNAVPAAPAADAGGEPALPSTRGTELFKNMVFLPRDVNTQFVMPAFRAAIGVECNFCHVFGAQLERGHANERELDGNPKKLIARGMIGMMKEINAALFPNDDVDIVLTAASEPPRGTHYVTCYACHRGNHVPATAPAAVASNR
jgi:hypothetical protein